MSKYLYLRVQKYSHWRYVQTQEEPNLNHWKLRPSESILIAFMLSIIRHLINHFCSQWYVRKINPVSKRKHNFCLCCCSSVESDAQSLEKECLHGINTKIIIKSLLFIKSNNLNYLVLISYSFGHSQNVMNYVRFCWAIGSQTG